MLNKLLFYVKKNYGIDATKRRLGVDFYSLYNILFDKQKKLSIKKLRGFIKFASDINYDLSLENLEKNIIKIGCRGKAKLMTINGFPLYLNNKNWAYIFGCILDSWPKLYNIVIEDNKFREELIKIIKGIGVNPTIYKEKNGEIKIKGHSMIGQLLKIGGIDINNRQVISNKPFPYWILTLDDREFHSILLSKIIDTEGHVSYEKPLIRISQSNYIDITDEEKKYIIKNCKRTIIKPSNVRSDVIIFSKLNKKLKNKFLNNPSLILLSVQLLFKKYKINSIIYPINLYISSNKRASVSWHLIIKYQKDINKIYKLCWKKISINYKKDRLKNILKLQREEHLPMNLRLIYFLIGAYDLEKEKREFTSQDLINKLNKKKKTINETIRYLAKNNLIYQISKYGRFKIWKLTKKGKKILEEKDVNNLKELEELFF